MLLLYTDFGYQGPYVGQMHAVLAAEAPGVAVIDLMHDAPRYNPRAAGHLLHALAGHFAEGSICVAVVDPGVGSARRALAIEAAGRWFVGPDNGLFKPLTRRWPQANWHEIRWRPQHCSPSFHGRDLFAPVAAALARGTGMERLAAIEPPTVDTSDLAEVIYIDAFGNAMTGLRAEQLGPACCIQVNGQVLPPAVTFSDHPQGTAFWYRNSLGLVEIAVNQGHAARRLGLEPGQAILVDE